MHQTLNHMYAHIYFELDNHDQVDFSTPIPCKVTGRNFTANREGEIYLVMVVEAIAYTNRIIRASVCVKARHIEGCQGHFSPCRFPLPFLPAISPCHFSLPFFFLPFPPAISPCHFPLPFLPFIFLPAASSQPVLRPPSPHPCRPPRVETRAVHKLLRPPAGARGDEAVTCQAEARLDARGKRAEGVIPWVCCISIDKDAWPRVEGRKLDAGVGKRSGPEATEILQQEVYHVVSTAALCPI